MKVLLTVATLLVCGIVRESQAQYAASGWRPNGPSFELPQRIPEAQNNQNQEYLPPVDPRNLPRNPNQQYGPPEVDVSVQGLPTQEQVPIFQVSPINGQQYVGPNLNSDIRNLDQNLKQVQAQQEVYRQFAIQRQLDAQASNANRQSNQQIPRQFVPRTTASPTSATLTTPTTAKSDEFRTTQVDSTTEALNLNEGEILKDNSQPAAQKKDKVTVEVSKQNVQEYPPEFFLGPLAQLKYQSQYVPVQLGQIRAPVYFQPAQGVSQNQIAAGYDGETHIAALPSVLAQQQLLQSQAQVQSQQGVGQNPAYLVPQVQQPNPVAIPQNGQQFLTQYQTVNPYQATSQNDQQLLGQYQPVNQYQPAVNQYEAVQTQYQFPQIQAQPVAFQPQVNQIPLNPNPKQLETDDQKTQFVYQQFYQPQGYQQPMIQPNQYQPQEQALVSPAQLINPNDYYQQQILRQPQVPQGQEGSLQSGLDVNQQGNEIGQSKDNETKDDDDEGSTATSMATAFGSRSRPRIPDTYGAPAPRVQANPDTSSESAHDEATDEGQAVAEATAVAKSAGKRKSAKLRTRRIRPIFTLDRSGHLVLAQEE